MTGGSDLTLWEVNEASTLITEAAHPDAEIIFGAVIDPNMGDSVSVTVIATGFGAQAARAAAGLTESANATPQGYEHIQLSVPSMMSPEPQPAMVPPSALAPAPAEPVREEAPAAASGRAALPRDILLAKARAYRDSQHRSDGPAQEQLSMNMDEAMPTRLSPEPARSPFDSDSLEVPSYLRRKRGLGTEQLDGE